MTTNYPTSIDTFVNPTSNDSLNAPSHSQQHTNLNDAMVAVQTKLGYGNANKVGAYLVNKTDFTGSGGIIIDNCFNSNYEWYRIEGSWISSASTYLNMQSRITSGGVISTDNGTSYVFNEGGGAANYSQTYVRWSYSYAASNCPSIFTTDIFNPISTTYKTTYTNKWMGSQPNSSQFASTYSDGIYNSLSSMTGIYLYPSSGTITGTVRVYGLRDS